MEYENNPFIRPQTPEGLMPRAYRQPPKPPEFHAEPSVPGLELNNYVDHKPSEDGAYVLIVEHTERIEKIKQPLTPEEKAQRRRENSLAMIAFGGVGAVICGILLWGAVQDPKSEPEIEKAKNE